MCCAHIWLWVGIITAGSQLRCDNWETQNCIQQKEVILKIGEHWQRLSLPFAFALLVDLQMSANRA